MDEEQQTLEETQVQHLAPAQSPRPPRKQHLGPWWIALLIFAAASYWLIQRYRRDHAPVDASRLGTPGGVAVTTAVAKRGNIGIYLDSIGTVTPVYTSAVTAQVNGLVIGVHYVEGQIVQKGAPLIDIDPRPFQSEVEQTRKPGFVVNLLPELFRQEIHKPANGDSRTLSTRARAAKS